MKPFSIIADANKMMPKPKAKSKNATRAVGSKRRSTGFKAVADEVAAIQAREHDENQEAAAEANRQAEEARLEAEKKAEEAEQKAAQARADAEEQAAENQVNKSVGPCLFHASHISHP